MRRKVTEEKWAEAAQWKSEGLKNFQIAERLGVTPGRVSHKLGKRREQKQDDPTSQSPK
jgi:hypothetical protein